MGDPATFEQAGSYGATLRKKGDWLWECLRESRRLEGRREFFPRLLLTQPLNLPHW